MQLKGTDAHRNLHRHKGTHNVILLLTEMIHSFFISLLFLSEVHSHWYCVLLFATVAWLGLTVNVFK